MFYSLEELGNVLSYNQQNKKTARPVLQEEFVETCLISKPKAKPNQPMKQTKKAPTKTTLTHQEK